TTLKDLSDIADRYHKLRNYSKNGILRKDRKNHVTILVTDEFTFYTSTPLTEEQFVQLLNSIEDLASNLSPNLVLVFSSFAVVDEGIVYNTVVHVQGGKRSVVR